MDLETFLNKFPPPGKVLFAKVWGSRSHNTHKESSDTDFAGVYVCPTKDILSMDPPAPTWKHDKEDSPEVSKAEWPDYQFHEVGKFCELLYKGNPGILEMLYTEGLCMFTPDWETLRVIKDQFLSRHSLHQYLGYMNGQLKRLTAHQGQKGLHTTGGKYNEKWAYHILRLAMDAERIAQCRGPLVWKDGKERDFLMKVRNEEVSWEECKKLIEDAIARVEELDKTSKLPETGDKEALNKWLLKVRMDHM